MQVELVDQSACEITNVITLNQGTFDFCEETVIEAARLGCPAAFQWLVECYETRIFRIAQRIAHSREDAEEIKQNAFVQAFKNMARFRGNSRFFTWLGRITINEGRSGAVASKTFPWITPLRLKTVLFVASSRITGQILNSAARQGDCGPFLQR